MGYSPDISGFPYWNTSSIVKVERKSWDKVAKDLMRLSGQKVSLEKELNKKENWLDKEMLKNEKLKREKKSLKGERNHLSNKVKKLKEKFQEDWETGTEKIAQQLSEALEAKKKLKLENKKLKQEITEWEEEVSSIQSVAEGFEWDLNKYKEAESLLLVQPNPEAFAEKIKELKLELKAAQEVSVVYMKRYEQKAKEETQIDKICSRIKCEDTIGHLIGKVPQH